MHTVSIAGACVVPRPQRPQEDHQRQRLIEMQKQGLITQNKPW